MTQVCVPRAMVRKVLRDTQQSELICALSRIAANGSIHVDARGASVTKSLCVMHLLSLSKLRRAREPAQCSQRPMARDPANMWTTVACTPRAAKGQEPARTREPWPQARALMAVPGGASAHALPHTARASSK